MANVAPLPAPKSAMDTASPFKGKPSTTCSELPIPKSLEHVVMLCLQKNPDDRPQTVADLDALLAACTDIREWTQAEATQWWTLHRPTPASSKASRSDALRVET